MYDKQKQIVADITAQVGITINGSKKYDIKVLDDKFYPALLANGTLGFGESYMDGYWECDQIDELTSKLLMRESDTKIQSKLTLIAEHLKAKVLNQQNKIRSKKVAEEHYNVGNDLYELMLDKYMQYTCGYWKEAKTLKAAQEAKLDLVCKKLGLKKGMKILELGSGFGGLSYWMAKKYGCTVEAYNISTEQVKFARTLCKGLPVTFHVRDYREATGLFDRVVSIGMMEHVGPKNYAGFMELAHSRLIDGGLFLMHTIGGNLSELTTEPWFGKYIFPGSVLPSVQQIAKASEGIFVMEDWHNLSTDYDKTLMAWFERFDKGWSKISGKYNERFYRMWKYYLLMAAGSFRARKNQLWQVVFSKGVYKGGYKSIR
ncbi:MAG: cyclopropane-fatty-acyl-phospholipid synthase [Candidatus Woesearchaeota archaeon]|jgi:cyclopropane-fatty-acyl-phospholipid synthase